MKTGFYEERKFVCEHPEFYAAINRKNIKPAGEIKYLDIGCANGTGIKMVAQELGINEKNLYGIDVVSHKQATKFTYKQTDLSREKLPFAGFDVISSFEVIEHIYDTKHFIQEIKKALNENGYFVLSTPNLAWWANRILLLLGYQPANTEVDLYSSMHGKPKIMKESIGAGHIRVFTKKALDDFLKANGFKVVKIIPFSSEYKGWLRAVSIIDYVLSKLPGCARNYVYICKKRH